MAGIALLCLTFALPAALAWPDVDVRIHPPADVHAMVLIVKTENTGCLSTVVYWEPEEGAPYDADFIVHALDDHSLSGIDLPDRPQGTPLSTERYMMTSASMFEAKYEESAYRDHVDLAGVGWSRSEKMDSTYRNPMIVEGSAATTCWQDSRLPPDMRHPVDRWYVYIGSYFPIVEVGVFVRETGSMKGAARVVNHTYSASDAFHVSPVWEWDAVLDQQSASGSRTVQATREMEIEHAFAGLFFDFHVNDVSTWTSPTGRVGSSLAHCGNVCYVATGGRSDDAFVHGIEPGTWNWRVEAQASRAWSQSALMWTDLPEPPVPT